MAKTRADREDGNGRRWVTVSEDRRLKVRKWIKAQAQDHQRLPYTINGAMSKILADAIDQLP